MEYKIQVGRRHEQDADRACDDMVESQVKIDKILKFKILILNLKS